MGRLWGHFSSQAPQPTQLWGRSSSSISFHLARARSRFWYMAYSFHTRKVPGMSTPAGQGMQYRQPVQPLRTF